MSLVLGGDHSISYPFVWDFTKNLGGPMDILHLDAHPDIYHYFEGKKYSHASSFAQIMEVWSCNATFAIGHQIYNKGRSRVG